MLPFWLCLAFAAALAALARGTARPRAAKLLVAAIGIAVVVDYAPSARRFAEGHRMRVLERAAVMLRGLEGEGGTVRVAVARQFDPRHSWLLAQAPTGYARGWLAWQAGKHWNEFATEATHDNPSRADALWLELLQIARVRYFLASDRAGLPPPWQVRDASGNLALWELPEVSPPAAGYRAWTRLEAELAEDLAARIARAVADHALLIHAAADAARPPPREPPGPEPFAVAYRRPEPERIVLELDAGAEPALIFVSESHHPWWRVTIDGEPGVLLRAQHTFMAVAVAAGVHRVELHFERPLWLAAVDRTSQLACAALLFGALIWALGRLRRRPTSGSA